MSRSLRAPILRRALLYVPGSSRKMLLKSRALTDIDCVTYDLEDSVTHSQKPQARKNIAEILALPRVPGIREQTVRINAVSTGMAEEDLKAVLKHPGAVAGIDAIVVPKVNSASDLKLISDILTYHSQPHTKLIALIESVRAVVDIRSICSSTPTRLSGLIFAAEDFALDLSLTRTPSLSEFLLARQTIVTAARAYELDSAIDLVCTEFKKPETLERECRDGAGMGFNGKQVIHPNQVAVAQAVFRPGEERVKDAVRILVAERWAEGEGRGSWGLDGRMIDRPVIEAARKVVERARLAGMEEVVGRIEEEEKETRPE